MMNIKKVIILADKIKNQIKKVQKFKKDFFPKKFLAIEFRKLIPKKKYILSISGRFNSFMN